ncbi:MAG: Hsp20/alpha crystallin family protein [Deltaproteobacteria bacterium]|nr:Hsp20/alpha crystallin family protein [Deltaproteobacteria bacterium]
MITQGEERYSELDNGQAGRYFKPACDIFESGDAVVVLVNMPGVNEQGVDVSIENNVLVISGKVDRPESVQHRFERREYEEGDYYRTLGLSEAIDTGRIEASMKDGMLRLTLPKSERHRPRKIEVKSA